MKFKVPLGFLDWLIQFCSAAFGGVEPYINIIWINLNKSNLPQNPSLLEEYTNIA
jgi:hypothetical protein